jgi:hypothetical protein
VKDGKVKATTEIEKLMISGGRMCRLSVPVDLRIPPPRRWP